MPWDGVLPCPAYLKESIENMYFKHFKTQESVSNLIKLVYVNKTAADQALVKKIVEAAEHPRALDAFVSMWFTPKLKYSFDEMLDMVDCPVALLYGKEDPWVVPMWGQRLKRRCPEADYFELTPAGHCPHHEVPFAVNRVIESWIQAKVNDGPCPLPVGESW